MASKFTSIIHSPQTYAECFYTQGRQSTTMASRKIDKITCAVLQDTLNALCEGTKLSDFSLQTHFIVPHSHIHTTVTPNEAWDKFQRFQLYHGHLPTISLPQSPPRNSNLINARHVFSRTYHKYRQCF